MVLRMVIGLALTIAAASLAARRLSWLYRVAQAGQPAPARIAESAPARAGARAIS